MSDHTYDIMGALKYAMEDIAEAVLEETRRDGGEGGDASTLAELVLCVDTEIVRDVMVAVGGPTRWFRFVFASGAKMAREDEHSQDDLKRVEYHDSWGANDRTMVTLSNEEADAVVSALGYMVGIE